MKRRITQRGVLIAACSVVACLLAACGGSDNNNSSSPHLVTNIAVPNSTTPAFSFDIGYADQGKYFLADRNNKAVDVVDTASNKLIAQMTGSFAGNGATTSSSGPDGLVGLPGTSTLYVGDVNAVKVMNTSTQTLTKTIPIGTTGNRTDEGCFDPDDHLIAMANPADSPPFLTFVNTDTQAVVSHLNFTGSAGLEACEYDAGTKSFLINNDGTAANPEGELDVIPASSVTAARVTRKTRSEYWLTTSTAWRRRSRGARTRPVALPTRSGRRRTRWPRSSTLPRLRSSAAMSIAIPCSGTGRPRRCSGIPPPK